MYRAIFDREKKSDMPILRLTTFNLRRKENAPKRQNDTKRKIERFYDRAADGPNACNADNCIYVRRCVQYDAQGKKKHSGKRGKMPD